MSIVREYAEVLYLYYDPVDNGFYDDDGFHVDNILDILTPADLLLFRNNYDVNTFTHRFQKNTVCIIETEDVEYEL